MSAWKAVVIVVGLAALGSVIVFMSVLAASKGFDWNFDDIVVLAKTTGLTILVGGSLVTILAICFSRNKPDIDLL
ncbi:hypothetical protein HY413_03610 [Candidatus Kaiserbacteria bacterium]|nr:hypothetical protein [Candidatus Kaiserbacteria bacterium]